MTLRQQWWKLLWLLAIAGLGDGVTGLAVWAMFRSPLQWPHYADEWFFFLYMIGFRTVLVVLAGAAVWATWVFAMMIVRPATLTLSPEGLAFRGAFRQRFWRWDVICGFRTHSSNSGTPVGVAFEVHDPALPRIQMGYLPAAWPLSIRGVIGYLEEAQRHYLAGRPPPTPWPNGPPPLPTGPGSGERWYESDFVGLAGYMIVMFGMVILMALGGLAGRAKQRRTDVFLTAPRFEHGPGCPTSLRVGDYLPHGCFDDRYDVGGNSARFNLPTVSEKRSQHWVRIGDDAVQLDCAGAYGCRAAKVAAGRFARRD